MRNLSAPVKNINIYPCSAKRVDCVPAWKGNTINNTASMLFYVLEGGFILNIGEYSGFVRKNQMALIPEGKHHSFWLMPDKKMTMLDFAFHGECNGEELFDFFGCNEDGYVISMPEREIMDIYESANTPPMATALTAALKINECSEYARLCSMYIKARVAQDMVKKEFAPVIGYMREHIAEDVSLEELAALVNYDTTYLSAKFKKEAGISPMRYFAEMRAKKAASLLRETDLPLTKIAEAIGISNIYYFKKFFEHNMGVQPEKYKDIFIAPPTLPTGPSK